MNPGKVSESVLKRSILKPIESVCEEMVQGPGVGADCALFSFSKEAFVALSVSTFSPKEGEADYMIAASVNNVAASFAEPKAILVSAVFPTDMYENHMRKWMEEIERQCKELGIAIAGGDTKVLSAVKEPVFTITVLGVRKETKEKQIVPEQDVVVTKWIGLTGTAILARERREELEAHLPPGYIEQGAKLWQYASIFPEAATAMKSNVSGMHDVSYGGIFRALWELAEHAGVGLEIDLKKIPVKQETIEICEALGLNPYELFSAGALLVVCDNGHHLVAELEKQGISATVIGQTTANNDKVIFNEEEKRFLDRPKTDELDSICM